MRRNKKRSSAPWVGNIRSVDVGERLRLVPIWERGVEKSNRLEIVIDPGPAFGIGDHPTTIMALEFLEREIKIFREKGPPPAMLDVGTGTGVLSIAGMAMGTGFTVGLDIDPSAVFTARRNLQINALTLSVDPGLAAFFIGGVQSVGRTFEIVAANLAAPTLLRIKDDLIACTGSLLILSGIAEVMADEVIGNYGSGGLKLIRREQREGWAAAVLYQCACKAVRSGEPFL
ncbi:MAG: 50S ribosomal protein L11 methyltransferase [Desulfomonile tiedjei]|uniref:50S ribosomal protein L11 methyltransferase n=1 Tax=Desulfomonile tiedjei TaxID=2358 RepID=A0A9D6V1P0_9BACT|nr:50S ribosomal protein L11 methyltransferase [Desulfomonile tiedjei]